jgi:hypothetical protein
MTFTSIRSRLAAGVLTSVAILGAAPTVSAQTVFVDDAKLIDTSTKGLQSLRLTKSIDWGLFAVDVFTTNGSTFKFGYSGIAELYMMFDGKPGTLVDQAMVLNTPPVVTNSGMTSPYTSTFAPGETKYFAYWDDRGGALNESLGINLGRVSPEDLYGWVALTRVGSTLAVTASATAKASPIVVGSFTAAVPEPESWALFALGVAGICMVRRRV